MKVNVPGFDRPIFQPHTGTRNDPSFRAARGFASLFGKMVVHALLKGANDESDGLMGMGNGPAAEIYGSFLENALGKVLANSPAMTPLVNQIRNELQRHGASDADRELSRERQRALTSALSAVDPTLGSFSPLFDLPRDSRGPVLLPPPPGRYAPIYQLPPPPEK